MSYYIIAKATGLIVSDGPNKTRAYKTFGSACATRTRVCRKAGYTVNELDVVNTQTYKPRQVTRKELDEWCRVPGGCEHTLLLLALERNLLEHVIG